jgi:hypothetical protein
MDKLKANKMGVEVKAAMQIIAAKYGMEYRSKGGTFDDFMFHPKGEFLEKAIDGVSVEKLEFEKYASLFGLQASDYKRVIVHKGEDYQLIGFELKRRKFPIKIQSVKDNTKILLISDDHREIEKIKGKTSDVVIH